MSTQLDKYSKAVAALKDHQRANATVFEEHQRLLFNVMDAENELRDKVAETKQGEKGLDHEVTVQEQTQEVWEEEKTLQALGLTKQGAIDRGLIAVNQRPPRISIKEVK